MALSHSDSAIVCLAGGSESDDSFEAKLIATRCRSTAHLMGGAKLSSPSAIPEPKIWRRNSKKQDTATTSAFKLEILRQLDVSEVHQIAVPCFDCCPATEFTALELEEWTKDFLFFKRCLVRMIPAANRYIFTSNLF
jgi:hypothetical protein